MESKHLAIVIIMIVLMILSVILILVSQSISAKKDVLISQLKQRVPENVVIHKTENIIIKQDPLVKLLGLGISVILHRISTKRVANDRPEQSSDSATVNDAPVI